jgi:HsdM N-terminal domain/HNH endonuclease
VRQVTHPVTDVRSHANLVWSIAELLRGDYKQADYGKVILPLIVMRRLDQTLERTKPAVVERAAALETQGIHRALSARSSIVRAGREKCSRKSKGTSSNSTPTNTDLTGDHRVPLSRGGTSTLENVQVLCRRHNSAKRDR